MSNAYHYTECGLDNVFLLNGFEFVETKRGPGVRIENAVGLHQVIGLSLARIGRSLQGQEIRFLREMLDQTQKEFGELVGYADGQMVSAWENDRAEMPKSVEAVLREMVLDEFEPVRQTRVQEILRRIAQAALDPVRLNLRESNDRWCSDAAVAA